MPPGAANSYHGSAISTAFADRRFWERDRKSTRLNSSHVEISYAVFCLKKKNATNANQVKELTKRVSRPNLQDLFNNASNIHSHPITKNTIHRNTIDLDPLDWQSQLLPH